MVTADQVLPTAICAADGSVSCTGAAVSAPEGHAWLSAQLAPTTNRWPRLRATESGLRHPDASLMVWPTLT